MIKLRSMVLTIAFFLLQPIGLFAREADAPDQVELIRHLAARVQYLEDMQAIQQLQSRYVHWLFTQDYEKILEHCIASRADGIAVEFSDSGVYRGIESVTRLYRAFEATKQVPGFFTLHMMVDPVIEIAGDGGSARSAWLSPGATASPAGARWVWGPYYVDYVKEDNEWRIRRTLFAPLFRNRYENSWVTETDHGSVRPSLPLEPDGPPTRYRPYDPNEKDLFRDAPELPEAYAGETP